MSEENSQGGRPTKFKPEYCEQARKLALLGATDAEVAEFFGVTEQTVNNWKIDFPEFFESIRAGKITADSEVATKLYDRARGAEWTEQQAIKCKTVEYIDGKKHEKEDVVIVDVKRAAPPDTQAASLWMRNRRPKDWREKVDHELTGRDGKDLNPPAQIAITEEAVKSIAQSIRDEF